MDTHRLLLKVKAALNVRTGSRSIDYWVCQPPEPKKCLHLPVTPCVPDVFDLTETETLLDNNKEQPLEEQKPSQCFICLSPRFHFTSMKHTHTWIQTLLMFLLLLKYQQYDSGWTFIDNGFYSIGSIEMYLCVTITCWKRLVDVYFNPLFSNILKHFLEKENVSDLQLGSSVMGPINALYFCVELNCNAHWLRHPTLAEGHSKHWLHRSDKIRSSQGTIARMCLSGEIGW